MLACVWRPEENFQELVLFFSHVVCGLQRSSSTLPHLVVKLYLLSRPEDPACLIPLDPVFVEDCFLFFRQHSALAYQPERFSLVVIFIMRSPRSLDNLCWSLKLKVFQAGYELDVFPRQDSKSVSCLSFSAVGITCEKDLLGSSHRRHVL